MASDLFCTTSLLVTPKIVIIVKTRTAMNHVVKCQEVFYKSTLFSKSLYSEVALTR